MQAWPSSLQSLVARSEGEAAQATERVFMLDTVTRKPETPTEPQRTLLAVPEATMANDGGAYTLAEAARLLGVERSRLEALFRADNKKRRVLAPSHGTSGRNVYLSFLDLVEARVALELLKHGLTKSEIREARALFIERWKVDNPFAHAKVRSFGRELHAANPEDKRWETGAGQFPLPDETIAQYLSDVDFDPQTDLATRWHIADGIVIDAAVARGAPLDEASYYQISVLVDALAGQDGDAERAAKWWGLSDPAAFTRAQAFYNTRLAA